MHSTVALRRAASSAHFTLASGAQIPKIGYGTWKLNKEEAHAGVADALKAGFRHIDSAWAYKNEDATGSAIAKSGIPRKDLFITSKLWNSFHGDNVEMGVDASLRDLGTDYLDLYLMHWPVAFANPKNSELSALKSQDGRPIENHILSEDLIRTWTNLEKLVEKGKVRNIGISNFNIRRVETLLSEAKINPVANQVEVNWGVPNDELLHYCEAHQVQLQAYSPLGSSDYVQEYTQDPVVVDVAKRNNISPVQVLLAWHIARGINPITRSRKPERLPELLEAAQVDLPWADVKHLLKEAENKPIQRVVDPKEAWNVKEDIFEDGVDQTRLTSLKTDSLDIPLPHEQGQVSAGTSAYLEPRNEPDAQLKPTEHIARFHTIAGDRSNTRGSRGSTVLQQIMKQRAFSSSSRASAAPSASSSASSRASSFLSGSSKQALATPGLTFADGRTSEPRETSKMNMCTFMLLVQQNNLTVAENTKLRAELAAVPLPEGVDPKDRATFKVIRTGIFSKVVRKAIHESRGSKRELQSLLPVLSGPIAVLTSPVLSPTYIGRLMSVIDKALGNKKAPPAAAPGASHAKSVTLNPRVIPLAAVIEGRKVVDIPALRDVSMIPDLSTLHAQIIGLLSSPASQLAGVLSMASGGKLALTLEGRKQQLEELEQKTS
ncbi:unnamed protein product [Sympodiomycopsis kandeliae]